MKKRKKAAPPVWLVFLASGGEDVARYARKTITQAATGRGILEERLRGVLRRKFHFAVSDPLIIVRQGFAAGFSRDVLVGQSFRRFVRPLEQ